MKNNSGKSTEAIPLQFEPCGEDIKKLMHRLVSTRHPDLVNCKIMPVWKNREMKNKGSTVAAKIQKLNDCIRSFADYHFIIVISSPTWQRLNDTQRMAVLDHEMCHVFYDDEDKAGNPTYSLISHDVEDFAQIIQLYGLYHNGLVEFGNAVKTALDNLSKDVVVRKLGEPGEEDPVEAASKGKKRGLKVARTEDNEEDFISEDL